MKQRKKKHTTKQNQQENRRHRNEFYMKLKQMMTLLGGAEAFDLMGDKMLGAIHKLHFHPIKVINPDDKESKTSSHNLRVINKGLSDMFHEKTVCLGKQQIPVSLYDFTVYVQTLYLLWMGAPRGMPAKAKEFQACFPLFADNFDDVLLKVAEEIDTCLHFVALDCSDFTKSVVSFVSEKSLKPEGASSDTPAGYRNFVLQQKKPETEYLELDGHKRKIYRICIFYKHIFLPMAIKAGNLGITGLMEKLPLRVFIQQHALDRVEERLGDWFLESLYVRITNPLFKKPVPADGRNSYLFPVTVEGVKLGYLKADIIGDILLVRTFLFLTNNGTPEGKKLHKLVGLQKQDKKYLGIDKLGTFVFSDMRNDEKLKALFDEAGCGSLFQVDKEFIDRSGRKEFACAEFITHYLGMDKEPEQKQEQKPEQEVNAP